MSKNADNEKQRIVVDDDFPGGNIIVDRIHGTHIFVHQDVRDTRGFWFYWCFRVRGVAGKWIHVTFTGRDVFGSRGPAWSGDGGMTWSWIGKAATRRKSFKFRVQADLADVRFCFAMPYTEATLRRFITRYHGHSSLTIGTLCLTAKGRNAEAITAGNIGGTPRYKVLVTARHHACESMASHVVEGFLEHVLGDDADGVWFREYVGTKIVPFVDKDGVEDGDQGKNRTPRDHNRDYDDQSTHLTVIAIKEQIPKWLAGVPAIALDLHCPYIHDERIQLIGLEDERQWRAVCAFSSFLEGSQRGVLPFRPADNVPFSQGWNTSKNAGNGLDSSSWAWRLPGMLLATTVEIPYATASGAEVNAATARSFGHDLARAVRGFLEHINGVPAEHGT